MFQSNRFHAYSNENQPQVHIGDLIAWSLTPIVLLTASSILKGGWFWTVIGLVLWANVSGAQIAAYFLSMLALKQSPHKWHNVRLFCYIMLGLGLSNIMTVWLVGMFDFPLVKAVLFSLVCGQAGWLVFEGVQRFSAGKGRSILLFLGIGLTALVLISIGLEALPVQIESRQGESFVCAYTDPSQSAFCINLAAKNGLLPANRGTPLPTLAPERVSGTCKFQSPSETQVKIINDEAYQASVTIGDFSPVVIPANSIAVVIVPRGTYQFIQKFDDTAQTWPRMGTTTFNVNCFDWVAERQKP